MAVAVAKGQQWSFRLGAIRLNGRIYRLIFAAHTLTPAVDQRFLVSIRSFHRITPAEIGGSAAEPASRSSPRAAATRRDARRAHGGQPPAARPVPYSQRARARRGDAGRRALQDRDADDVTQADRPNGRGDPQQGQARGDPRARRRRMASRRSAPASSACPSPRRPARRFRQCADQGARCRRA